MIDKGKIIELAQGVISSVNAAIDRSCISSGSDSSSADEVGSELFLVEVNVGAGNDIEVVVDVDSVSAVGAAGGVLSVQYVSIEQCIAVSKGIEGLLDREVEDFSLSVFSAGIGQPFVCDRQYRKAVGRLVEVVGRGVGGGKVTGVLTGVDFSAASADYVASNSTLPLGKIEVEYGALEAVEGKKRKVEVMRRVWFELSEVKSVCEALTIK